MGAEGAGSGQWGKGEAKWRGARRPLRDRRLPASIPRFSSARRRDAKERRMFKLDPSPERPIARQSEGGDREPPQRRHAEAPTGH